MGQPTLLDTNIFIYLTKGGLDEPTLLRLRSATSSGFNLSVISKIELLGYAFPTIEEKEQAESFIKASTIFALNDDIVDKTIELRKARKIKLPDAIIAATAIVHNMILISRNDKDFAPIPSLRYSNPFSGD